MRWAEAGGGQVVLHALLDDPVGRQEIGEVVQGAGCRRRAATSTETATMAAMATAR